jgi:hypothetical protein
LWRSILLGSTLSLHIHHRKGGLGVEKLMVRDFANMMHDKLSGSTRAIGIAVLRTTNIKTEERKKRDR